MAGGRKMHVLPSVEGERKREESGLCDTFNGTSHRPQVCVSDSVALLVLPTALREGQVWASLATITNEGVPVAKDMSSSIFP